jgi:ABC-type lipoprotein export system ATPase subunit
MSLPVILIQKPAKRLWRSFIDIAHNENRCIIIVTHSNAVAKAADEVWGMKDGVLLPVRTAVNNK